SRWLTYTTRVRHLDLEQYFGIDHSVWRAILERSHGTPVLPNLRTLSMIIWRPTHALPSIRTLIAPSLRSVSLSFRGLLPDETLTPAAAADAGSILQELSIKSPGLTRLHLDYRDKIILGRDNLSCLSRFTKLEVLHILDNHSTFDEGLLRILVDLKKLISFTASILLEDSSDTSQLNLQGCLQELTTLNLRGSAPHLARLILSCSMPRLTRICLWVASHLESFPIALASICRHIGPHTLTSFRAHVLTPQHGPPPFLQTILHPLLSFINLEELEFFFAEHAPLRDEDLVRFVRAWPKLRMLVLQQHEARRRMPETLVPRPTLFGLVEVARGWPRLDRLCIPDLDVIAIPHRDLLPLLGHDLSYLCIQNVFGALDEDRQLNVALLLDRLFPRLNLNSGINELPHYGVDDQPRGLNAENIARFLRAMQIARTHYPGGVERAV
ncbi:hypothetical protein V8D89_001146, partial [Ganoderma adspersum]